MTLNTTYSPTVADGNGVTKSFSYSFNPISENYLKVSLEQNGSWVEQVSGWTATISENGGVVTFDTAPTTRVAIERDVPEEQPTSYKTSSGFQAQVIEHSFDMLTGMVQELKEKSDRSIAVDVGSSVNPQEVVAQVERVYDSIDNIDDVAGDLTNIDTVAGDLTNIDTVAGDKANIDAVAPNISKVNSVANSISAVNTVATNVAAVNAVANIRNQVITVAVNSAAITAVNNNKTNIDIVANNKSDVNTVASNISSVVNVGYNINHISRVDANKDNIDAVADDITNVNRVGGSINNVNSVAAGLDDISDVLDNMTNIDTVAGSITNVNLVGADISKVAGVADDLTNIDAVNANKTNIDIVASNNANVSRVGGNINNVNTVANSETDINTIADNISDVNNVASYLGNISAVASGITEVQAVAGDLSNIDGVSQYLGQIENVSDNITNVNEVGSNIANVNTVAGDHTNIQTVVNNMTAINNAPTYAAQAQQWAIGVPGEPSGGSAKYWAERAEDAASGMENPANRDLSNLTDTGQAVIETADATISNYIKEVPQKIKIELSGNDITIKSGSELVFGGTVYTTLTLTEDKTGTISSSLADGLYFVNGNAVGTPILTLISKFGSGASLPADNTNYNRFYLTTDSTFYYYSNNAWGGSDITYPVCIVKMESGVASIAKDSNGNDMIFNGAGFIGHHIFVLPNITVYRQNGINADGSMASIKSDTNALRIIEALSGYGVDSLKRWVCLQSNRSISNWTAYVEIEHETDADYSVANVRYYIRDLNLIKFFHNGEISVVDGLPLVEYYYDGSVITSFTPRQCVRLATVDMLNKVQAKVDTNTKAIAGKQDTLVSGTNIKTINSTTVLGNGNFTLADQSLSNLDSNGQMIIDSQNGTISNCVLDIPQNIKLTLENNVLTLKSGSILTDSGATYQTITITSDKTTTISTSSNNRWLIFATISGVLAPVVINNCVSGETDSKAGQPIHLWFDTTNKEVLYYGNDGTTGSHRTYPLCVVDVIDGAASFAKDSNGNDMIFNGAGFVGHHAFIYPNVRYLSGNGFDTNGKLASYRQMLGSLTISEMNSTTTTGDWFKAIVIRGNNNTVAGTAFCRNVQHFSELLQQSAKLQYVEDDNTAYAYTSGGYQAQSRLFYIRYEYNGTTVTDFTIRQPVRTATVEMLKDKQNDLTTVSGYDATKTQTLKNVNGTLTWVDD